jgi:hypothetical protein
MIATEEKGAAGREGCPEVLYSRAEFSCILAFGGWRLNRFFAIQLDYIDFGESSSTANLLNIRSDTTGFAPTVADAVWLTAAWRF